MGFAMFWNTTLIFISNIGLREEHRLSVFENRILRRMCGPERDEVIGVWTKLHNEEFHNLWSSIRIIRIIKSERMKWAGHVTCAETSVIHEDFGVKVIRKETIGKTWT
jgi:hypothetical protein